jgi:hypothetical protein
MDDKATNSQEKKCEKIFIISKIKRVKKWTEEEDKILVSMAKLYGFKNWKQIASHIPHRTEIQCCSRYARIKPGISKGSWKKEEDIQLIQLIQRFGKCWNIVSKFIPNRSSKQIRDRYLNTLDPWIKKEKFKPEEDAKIMELYYQYGTAWTKISKHIEGRTGDCIKNRFYSYLKKIIHKDEFLFLKYKKSTKKKRRKMRKSLMMKYSSKQIQNIERDLENKIEVIKLKEDLKVSNQNYNHENLFRYINSDNIHKDSFSNDESLKDIFNIDMIQEYKCSSISTHTISPNNSETTNENPFTSAFSTRDILENQLNTLNNILSNTYKILDALKN